MKITQNTKLKEILEREELFDVLIEHGFPCISCPFAKLEMNLLYVKTICEMYNIDKKKLIKDLNDFLKNQ